MVLAVCCGILGSRCDYLLVKLIRVQEWRGAEFVQITCTKFAFANNIQFSLSSKICKCVNIWENRVSLSTAGGLGLLLESEREKQQGKARAKNTSVCISYETHLFQREPCFWVLAFLGTVSDWCCLSLCATLYPHPASTTPTAARLLLQGGRQTAT